jgi:hypothetical protein
MRKQRLTLDITLSIQYRVQAQVSKVKFHIVQSAKDNIAVVFDPPCVESDAEHFEFIDSLPADNQHVSPVVQRVEDGVCSPNKPEGVSKAANK